MLSGSFIEVFADTISVVVVVFFFLAIWLLTSLFLNQGLTLGYLIESAKS